MPIDILSRFEVSRPGENNPAQQILTDKSDNEGEHTALALYSQIVNISSLGF